METMSIHKRKHKSRYKRRIVVQMKKHALEDSKTLSNAKCVLQEQAQTANGGVMQNATDEN